MKSVWLDLSPALAPKQNEKGGKCTIKMHQNCRTLKIQIVNVQQVYDKHDENADKGLLLFLFLVYHVTSNKLLF